jgi:hypothetical protein
MTHLPRGRLQELVSQLDAPRAEPIARRSGRCCPFDATHNGGRRALRSTESPQLSSRAGGAARSVRDSRDDVAPGTDECATRPCRVDLCDAGRAGECRRAIVPRCPRWLCRPRLRYAGAVRRNYRWSGRRSAHGVQSPGCHRAGGDGACVRSAAATVSPVRCAAGGRRARGRSSCQPSADSGCGWWRFQRFDDGRATAPHELPSRVSGCE